MKVNYQAVIMLVLMVFGIFLDAQFESDWSYFFYAAVIIFLLMIINPQEVSP